LNKYHSLQTLLFDLNNTAELPSADVVLLSDVNYNQESFDALIRLIENYRKKQVSIILSTPQRLQAKTFVERIMAYIQLQTTITIKDTDITIFVI
jgi:predicted nicotinamide N-methyase